MSRLSFCPRELEQDPNALERFKQEARAASALNHPNICTIYAIEECDGQHFIAMELLEGQSLDEKIDGHPLAPGSRYSIIGIQVTRCAGCRARQGHRASRSEAGQHLSHHARAGQDSGFWTGEADLRSPRGAGNSCRQCCHRFAVDAHVAGNRGGHRRLHVSRAGARRGTRRPQRSVFAGRPSSTKWRPARFPSTGNTSAVIFQGILDRDPRPAGGTESRRYRSSWKRLSTRRWRRTVTCAIRVRPRCAPT